jgi:hypothetical protein
MDNLFALLVLASLVLLVIGLFKPTTSLFWDKKERTRKKSAIVYGGLTILFFILFGVTTDRKKADIASNKEQQAATVSTKSQKTEPATTQPEKVTKENPFDNTQSLTNTLSQNGIGELKPWSNPMEMGWGSLTDYFQFGNKKDGVGMQNNIAYYLEGDEKSAKTLTINLNINNPANKKNALKFLNEIAIKTFKSLNLDIPNGLTNSILAPKPFKADTDNFAISVVLDKSKIETWKVNIVRQ